MKSLYSLIVLLVVTLIGLSLYKKPAHLKRPIYQDPEVAAAVAPEFANVLPAVSGESKAEHLQKLSSKIATLSREMKDIDQELRNLDFPKVLLDERLSENERRHIISKVEKASGLQDQITRLRVQKIDLETTASL